jgi:MFS family permease
MQFVTSFNSSLRYLFLGRVATAVSTQMLMVVAVQIGSSGRIKVAWRGRLLQLPMGWLVDRYGVKWPYSTCFVLWCLGAAATGLLGTLSTLILVRLPIGATEAVVAPATYRYLANNFEESQKGTALGIYSVGGKIGPALGAPIAAWLIASASWKMMFITHWPGRADLADAVVADAQERFPVQNRACRGSRVGCFTWAAITRCP